MAFSQTPVTGLRLGEVIKATGDKTNAVAQGTMVKADDGHDYIFAKATGAIGSTGRADLTEPAMTVASNASGAWQNASGTALVSTDSAWFKRFVI